MDNPLSDEIQQEKTVEELPPTQPLEVQHHPEQQQQPQRDEGMNMFAVCFTMYLCHPHQTSQRSLLHLQQLRCFLIKLLPLFVMKFCFSFFQPARVRKGPFRAEQFAGLRDLFRVKNI